MLLLVLLSGSSTSQPDYSLPNLVLMAIYVGLTLVIAGAAIWSTNITRKALKTSSELSRDALAASDRQSREAIEAVQRQIEASERQSKETIDAVNRQIEASERQAQEALYNQHKPIVIPLDDQLSQSLKLQRLTDSTGNQTFTLGISNKGAGVALNVFSIVGLDGFPDVLCSASTRILVHDAEYGTLFYFKAGGKLIYSSNAFDGIPVFPEGVFGYLRLMLTYSDLFNNKYFVVYDYSEEFGWRQLNDVKRVEKRLDELVTPKP
jgi:hypothetical protein